MGLSIYNPSSGSGGIPIGAQVTAVVGTLEDDTNYVSAVQNNVLPQSSFPEMYTKMGLQIDNTSQMTFIPLPDFGSLQVNDVVYGTVYVALASGGQIATSSDGITWTYRTTLTGQPTVLSYANGYYFASDRGVNSNTSYYSSDGITWNSISGRTIGRVVYVNSNYVGSSIDASGQNVSIFVGNTPSAWSTPAGVSSSGTYIATTNFLATSGTQVTLLVDLDRNDTGGAFVKYYTFDITTDSASLATSGDTDIHQIGKYTSYGSWASFGGNYCVLGRKNTDDVSIYYPYSSNSLTTWTKEVGFSIYSPSNIELRTVGSRYAICTNGTTINWTTNLTSWTTDIFGAIAATNGTNIVSGDNVGALRYTTSTSNLTQTIPTTPFTNTTTYQVTGVASDGATKIGTVSQSVSKIQYSLDGGTIFQSVASTAQPPNTTTIHTPLIYGLGKFYLGYAGATIPQYSTNFTSWTNCSGLPAEQCRGWYYTGTAVLVTLSSGTYRSTNGTSFTLVNSTMNATLTSIYKVGSALIARSNSRFFKSVDDGINWAEFTIPAGVLQNQTIVDDAISDGSYLYVRTNSSSIQIKTDGVSFSRVSINLSNYKTQSLSQPYIFFRNDGSFALGFDSASVSRIAYLGKAVSSATWHTDNSAIIGVAGGVYVGNPYGYDVTTSFCVPQSSSTVGTYVKVK